MWRTNHHKANDSNASLRRYQKDEVRCGQCFRNLEKICPLRHSLPTGCLKATRYRTFVDDLPRGAPGAGVTTDTNSDRWPAAAPNINGHVQLEVCSGPSALSAPTRLQRRSAARYAL